MQPFCQTGQSHDDGQGIDGLMLISIKKHHGQQTQCQSEEDILLGPVHEAERAETASQDAIGLLQSQIIRKLRQDAEEQQTGKISAAASSMQEALH